MTPAGRPEEPEDPARLRPLAAETLLVWGLVGLVAGWGYHRWAASGSGAIPVVTWAQVLALVLVAAILGGTAWATGRHVRDRRASLAAHHAVNRLVLARSCAYVGALVGGGYLGFALGWVGSESEQALLHGVQALLAGLAGLAVVVTALLLERACRVRSEDDEP